MSRVRALAGRSLAVAARPVEEEHDERRDVQRRVDEEARGDPGERKHDAAGRRPEHTRRIDDHLVQPDRARDPVSADEIDDVQLARGRVDSQDASVREPEREDHPEAYGTRGREHAEGGGDRAGRDLGRDQRLADVDVLEVRARPRAGEENRRERDRR